MTNITYIPGEIANAAVDEQGNRKPVTRTHNIFDDNKNKNQAEINVDIDNSLNQLSNEIDAVNKQDVITVDTLPDVSTADPKKIYRVVGDDNYTDYMVNTNGNDWKKLATYSFPGIDNEPTAGSNNLVKSGGVINALKPLIKKTKRIEQQGASSAEQTIEISDDNDNTIAKFSKQGFQIDDIYDLEGKELIVKVNSLQSLSNEEKIRGRNNIGAASQEDMEQEKNKTKFISYNAGSLIEQCIQVVDDDDSVICELKEDGVHTKSYYDLDGNKVIAPFNNYDQAYILNGELVCNNDHPKNGTIAKYIQVDMNAPVQIIKCKVKFNGGQVCLCNHKNKTKHHINDITNGTFGSIHLVWGNSACAYGIYSNGTWDSTTINYSEPIILGVEYEIGYQFKGSNVLRIYLPDSTYQDVTINGIDNLNGGTVVYEFYTYSQNKPNVVTNNFNRVTFTGFYCHVNDNNVMDLKDNFARNNGSLTTAPSGHVYTLFRNITSSDTNYEMSN